MISVWQAMRRALVSGACSSVASSVALAYRGTRDCGSALTPINAVSHWVWGDDALRQRGGSLRFTAVGYAIHHATATLWAVLYEKLAARHAPTPSALDAVNAAATIAAVSAVADFRLTPARFTPGFERCLSDRSLVAVYGALGAGLALHAVLRSRRRTRA